MYKQNCLKEPGPVSQKSEPMRAIAAVATVCALNKSPKPMF